MHRFQPPRKWIQTSLRGAIPAWLVLALLKDVLDPSLWGDVDKAMGIWLRDEEVDGLYGSLFREYLTYMMENPRNMGGVEVELGPTEFRLLRHFMENPGRVYSRDRILDAVWGRDINVEDRTVDVHIGRLRKALRVAAGRDPIRTVRGAGYSLEV